METIQREPARIGAAIISLITTLMALLVAFGVDITNAQQEAILGFVAAVVAIAAPFVVNEWYVRRKVTPTAAPRMEDGQPAIIVPASYWGSIVRSAQEAERHD